MTEPPRLPPPPPPPPPGPVPPPPQGPSRDFDFVRCLLFIKDDPRWLPKLLWGSLFTLLAALLIGIPFLAGYQMRVMARVARGVEPALPEWDDLGGLFVDGLKAILIALAHWLVVALLVSPLVAVFVLLPNRLPDGAALVLVLVTMTLVMLLVVCLLLLAVYLQVAILRLALHGDLAEAFRPAANFDFLRRNVLNIAFAYLVFLVAQMASQLGFLLCCVGLLPAAFLANLIHGYAMGEVARLDLQRFPLREDVPRGR